MTFLPNIAITIELFFLVLKLFYFMKPKIIVFVQYILFNFRNTELANSYEHEKKEKEKALTR